MAERRTSIMIFSGGNTLYGEEGFSYDLPTPKRCVRVKRKTSYSEFLNMVYRVMQVDKNLSRLKMTCRFPSTVGPHMTKYMPLEIIDDDSVDAMLDAVFESDKINSIDLYVEMEDMSEGWGTNQAPNPFTTPTMDRNKGLPNPGPIDPSVLHLQSQHRSTAIWEGRDFDRLSCRRSEASMRRVVGALDDRVLGYLLRAGFYGVSRLGFRQLDWHLITALVERWRIETHTFHLPVGEATVTLQDISILLGLPIDGDAITGRDTQRTIQEWQELCHELLGITPPATAFDGSRLRITVLTERLAQPIPDDANDNMIQSYARTYILVLLGGCLFADKSSSKVKLFFLPLLKDLDASGKLSWGSATLACLYRELCIATRTEALEIGGPLVLLQLWAWERLLHIRPQRYTIQPQAPLVVLSAAPLGCRWDVRLSHKDTPSHVLRHYRDQLDQMREEQMMWEPYTADVLAALPEYCLRGREIWLARVPLIYFSVVEWHHPDRVLRQFGLVQRIPVNCDTSQDLHSIDRRGRHGCDWAHRHRDYIELWGQRREHLITGEPVTGQIDESDPYLLWYKVITRRLIGPPIDRPPVGFQPVASIRELLEDTIARIYELSLDIEQGATGSTSPRDLMGTIRLIRDMSSTCLDAVYKKRHLYKQQPQAQTHPQPQCQRQPEGFNPPQPAHGTGVSTSSEQAFETSLTTTWTSALHAVPLQQVSPPSRLSLSPHASPIHLGHDVPKEEPMEGVTQVQSQSQSLSVCTRSRGCGRGRGRSRQSTNIDIGLCLSQFTHDTEHLMPVDQDRRAIRNRKRPPHG